MKLKLYRIFNAFWFLAIVLIAVGYIRELPSESTHLLIVHLAILAPFISIGGAAVEVKKQYKNDFLVSLVLGVISIILGVVNFIRMKIIYFDPFFGILSIISIILCTLQLVTTTIAMFGAEGKLFSKDKSDENTIANYTNKSLKNLPCVIGYLFVIAFLIIAVVNSVSEIHYGYPTRGIYFYVLSAILIICAISILCSFALYLSTNRSGKIFKVFTIVALSTFFASYIFVGRTLLWGFVIFSIVIIASTLAPKEKLLIKKSKAYYFILIAVGVMALLTYVMTIYAKAVYYYQYYLHKAYKVDIWTLIFGDYIIGSTTDVLTFPRGLVLLPLGAVILALIKKAINKKLLERVLLSSIIGIAICVVTLVFFAIFQLKNSIYPSYYPPSYSELPALTFEQQLPCYMCIGSHTLLLVSLIVAYIYTKRNNSKAIEESEIQENITTKTKKYLILDIVRKVAFIATSFMFVYLIPACFDRYGLKVNAIDFSGISFMARYDYGPPIVIGYYPLRIFCFILISISLLMSIIYTAYHFAYYQKNRLFDRIFGYAVFGQQILLYGIFVTIVIVSNIAQGTSFYTLSFIPIIFNVFSIAIITLDAYKERFIPILNSHKEKAAAKKQEKEAERLKKMEEKQKEREEKKAQAEKEKEMKQAIIREKKAQAEREREEMMKYQAALEAKEKEEERERVLQEKREREKQFLKYKTDNVKSVSESKIRQLQDLVNLKESGAINDEEFAQLKAEVLKGDNNNEI